MILRSEVAQIIEAARELRGQRQCTWHDYENYKRQLKVLLPFGHEFDRATKTLVEALGL